MGKGIALIDGKVISVLNFARTLSLPSVSFRAGNLVSYGRLRFACLRLRAWIVIYFLYPSFYGKGFRYSAHLRYDLSKNFMFLAKFGQTVYQDRETIGSGNDEIPGNRKADLQMQLRIKF